MMKTILFLAVLAVAVSGAAGRCADQNVRDLPENPAEAGPYDVGVIQTIIPMPTDRDGNRELITYVYYPAVPGSAEGNETITFDLREKLPDRYNESIPDETNPWIECEDVDCFWDLPLDAATGPFPVHVHIHGTGAWGYASLHQFTHYASRGFVVVAADHPGITLKDILTYDGSASYIDQTADAYHLVETLANPAAIPDLAFLAGNIDIAKLAVSGHSAGGSALRPMGDVAAVLMPWGSGGIGNNDDALITTLVMGGIEDGVVRYSGQVSGYNAAPPPKRLGGVEKTGHHFCTDLCWIGRDAGGIAQIAIDHGIPEGYLFRFLAEDGCDYFFTGEFIQPDGMYPDGSRVWEEGTWAATNYLTSAVQEEILMCNDDMTEWAARVQEFHPQMADYEQEL